MRDEFDHYYAGWTLISGQTPEDRAAFTEVVNHMGKTIKTQADLTEAWRVHPFDDKTSVFREFFKKALEKNIFLPEHGPTVAQIKTKLKL